MALHPDLSSPSQFWLAFQKCAVVSSLPSPILAQDQLCGRPASLRTRAHRAALTVQAPSAFRSARGAALQSWAAPSARFASDFSLPRFQAPPLPTLLPPGAACPSGLAARIPVQSSSPTMLFGGVLLAVQGKAWIRGGGVPPRGALVTLSQSRSPAGRARGPRLGHPRAPTDPSPQPLTSLPEPSDRARVAQCKRPGRGRQYGLPLPSPPAPLLSPGGSPGCPELV